MGKLKNRVITEEKCRCGQPAHFLSSKGDYWCSQETSSCPIIKKKAGEHRHVPNPLDPEKMRIKREKISQNMKARYAAGWESKAGRCKKYEYVSPIAGAIKVDGTWELNFCRYADLQNLKWKRNTKRFTYTKTDGNTASYQPDFYVEDWQAYVEVKGYETDLDRLKWSQFSEPLIVLRKKEIGELVERLMTASC